MARSTGSDKLVCQHVYFRWADFQLCRMEHGGYGLIVPCELADHWLTPDMDTPGRYVVSLTSFGYPSSVASLAARDA